MSKQPTWQEAIQQVLREAGEPMHYKDIAERIAVDGVRTDLGKTPKDTVTSTISMSKKYEGEASPFIRVNRGTYTLRDFISEDETPDKSVTPGESDVVTDSEPQYDIITSFGMFWQRSDVEWKTHPSLWGIQQAGADPVDFGDQLGVYLLYDGREVIYVGRATGKRLGQRLNEHTFDRLSTRWDRFSWFGLRPVAEDGSLGDAPVHYSADPLIPALEALLIEALEPRQNRKRGDDLSAAEFYQRIDPKIQKKALQRLIAEL